MHSFDDTVNLRSFINNSISVLADGDFYMIAQIHNSKINTPLEEAMLFNLHERGVQYDIAEYPHSAFFLVNEYLQTGDETILKTISEKAPFSFFKNVYRFNELQPQAKKIRFYGIDYELFNADRGTFYKNALMYIYQKRKAFVSNKMFHGLFAQLAEIDKNDLKALTAMHSRLYSLLDKKLQADDLFGVYKDDVWLILSAPTKYKSIPRRDKWLYERFTYVYEMLKKKSNNPKFIASFGISHVKTSNKKNITYKLLNYSSSPVKNKVIVIGTHYFNGGGGINKERTYTSAGILEYVTTMPVQDSIATIFKGSNEKGILLTQDCLKLLRKKIKPDMQLDWLLLFNQQPRIRYWKWE